MPDDIQELAKKLQESLDKALQANEQLVRERDQQLQKAQDAQARAREAEAAVQAVERKLEALEELRRESYQEVVAELFEIPSKESARQTTLVAVVSIVITVIITIFATQYSIQTGSRQGEYLINAVEKMGTVTEEGMRIESERAEREAQSLKAIERNQQLIKELQKEVQESQIETNAIASRALARVDFFWAKEHSSELVSAIDYLALESKNYSSYLDLNNIALFFKTRFVWKFPETSDEVFLEALRQSGVPDQTVTLVSGRLKEWTADCVALHQDWAASIEEAIASKQGLDDKQRHVANFKRESDTTEYGRVGYGDKSLSAEEVLRRVSYMLSVCQKHEAANRLDREGA